MNHSTPQDGAARKGTLYSLTSYPVTAAQASSSELKSLDSCIPWDPSAASEADLALEASFRPLPYSHPAWLWTPVLGRNGRLGDIDFVGAAETETGPARPARRQVGTYHVYRPERAGGESSSHDRLSR